MNTNKSIELLENLKTSISDNENFSLETIDALKLAIEKLKIEQNGGLPIDKNEISTVADVLRSNSLNPTYPRITKFLLGNHRQLPEQVTSHELFGKYKNIYKRGELTDFVMSMKNQARETSLQVKTKQHPEWMEITYFQERQFNKLSDNAINQLKDKIAEIELVNKDNLSSSILEYRKINPRYREPWSEKEIILLETAIKYTNDLELLSKSFGRTSKAIEVQGQQLINQAKTKI